MGCLSRPYQFNFSKGYLSQILSGPFLSTLPNFIPEEFLKIFYSHILKQLKSAALLMMWDLLSNEYSKKLT